MVGVLKEIGEPNIAISIVTAGELLFGAFNKRELNQISKDIEKINLLQINDDIGTRFLKLMKLYSLSHRLSLPDGLIAATCLELKIPLYTNNKKHFKYIDELILFKEK